MRNVQTSPFGEWWSHTFGSWLNVAVYWRERRAVLADPRITVDSRSSVLVSGPFKFALQSVVLVPLLTSVISSTLSYFSEIPPEYMKKLIEHVEELERRGMAPPASQRKAEPLFGVEARATRHEALEILMRARDQSQRLLPFLVSISILLSAWLFRISFRRWQTTFPLVSQADRAYLYYVAARLFIPITMFGLSSYIVDMSARYVIVPSGTVPVPGLPPHLSYAGFAWLFVKLILAVWVISALWSSTAVLSRVLGLHGTRNGRPVKGRRAVAVRIFAAQLSALLFVRFVETAALTGYYFLHI